MLLKILITLNVLLSVLLISGIYLVSRRYRQLQADIQKTAAIRAEYTRRRSLLKEKA